MTRDAAAIGAGLAPARAPRAIRAGERVHVVGVGGAGASAAALLARHAGAHPDGCDPGGPSPYTPALEEAGIALAWAHDPAHVTDPPTPDRLAVTKALTAVAPDHPELVAARERGVPLEPWQQVVADAASGRRLVGVSGTHGKSTTSGWLVHVLAAAGADPSAFVGALLPPSITGGLPATARWGTGEAFVVEADEYAGNFDPYRPSVALVTSLEWDHPDVFADLDAVVDAFARWLRAAAQGAARVAPPTAGGAAARGGAGQHTTLVANSADPGVDRLLERLADWPGPIVATALVETPRDRLATDVERLTARIAERLVSSERAAPARVVRAIVGRIARSGPTATELDVVGLGRDADSRTVRLPTAGRHNASNALCVAAGAAVLGVAPGRIVTGLASFPGIGRRLERKGEAAGVVVYDDYGHHPTAIRETLGAVRQREPGRRVWAVYEPLTYHRTAAMLASFAEALAAADGVAIADVWAGRDPDTTITSASAVAEAVAGRRSDIPVAAPGSVEATGAWLATVVRPGDVVLVMGGGRSYRIGEVLLERLERDR